MKLMDMHRVERPREKLARAGPGAMKDEELLALLLRTGYSGKNVLDLSREMIRRHGEKLARLGFDELAELKGVGSSRAGTIVAAFELARRLSPDAAPETVYDAPSKAVEHLAGLRRLKQEHFLALYLNARNHKLHEQTLFIGTLSSSLVHPREVFAPAIERRAAAVIVAHNHPSGDPSPSREDREATQRLRRAGELLGIELIDHLVVAERGYYSFREHLWS